MRILGIDTIRAVAALAVVLIHIFPTPSNAGFLKIIVTQAARFAVPFFFVGSGFFYAQRIHNGVSPKQALKKSMKRLVPVYFFWSLLYFFNPPIETIFRVGVDVVYRDRLIQLFSNFQNAILVGPGSHLWFFVSLILAIITFHLLAGYRKRKIIITLAIFLYIVGVMGKAYILTPIGLNLHINTRNFIFFSMLPFTLGYYLYRTEGKWKSFYFGLLLWVGGTILHFSEIVMLQKVYGMPMIRQNYVFSTVIMGIGAFVVGRSNLSFLKWRFSVKLGTLSLGIYAGHILIACRLHLIKKFITSDFVWMIIAPLLVFVSAAFLSYLLSKISFTKRFVS